MTRRRVAQRRGRLSPFAKERLGEPMHAQALRGLGLLLRSPRVAQARVARLVGPLRTAYRRRLRMSLRRWLLYHQHLAAGGTCSWMGVRMMKLPLDSWIYQEIIHEVKPEVIVEIGSADGGTTLYFAHLLDLLGNGEVVSVDIDHTQFKAEHRRIRTVTGDSKAAATVGAVADRCEGKRVLLVHDGDHSEAAVLSDLRAYSGFVGAGSYFIVEDGIMDLMRPGDGIGTFGGGPLRAVETFLEESADFVVDETRERYYLTYNPRGFLKRVDGSG